MLVVAAASAVATVGVVRIAAALDTPAAAASQVTVDGLTASATEAGWTKMDHDMSGNSPGYQMPPAMMPGMPTGGNQRLAVAVTVVNTSDDTRALRPGKEFVLHAGQEGKAWALHSDTFGDLPRLAPHNAVSGIVFFDLPPAELTGSPTWLEWTHNGSANRLTIPLDGASDNPGHSHNP